MHRRLKRFQALIEPRLERLYRVAYRLTGNRPDAEDLVQETCLLAWEKLPEQADIGHVDNWLTRVLYHRFVDAARRTHRAPVQALDGIDLWMETVPSQSPGPCELAEREDRERALDRAWQRLEAGQKVLLSLRAEGFGLVEIEEITGISRDVLRARLHRARQSLARHLRDADRTPVASTQTETSR